MAVTKIASVLGLAALASAASTGSGSANPCTCAGGVVNNVCVSNLATAFVRVPAGGTITVGGKHIITDSITFSKSLTLKGVQCNGQMATLSAKMEAGEAGILEVRGPGTLEITLDSILFTREKGSGSAAGFRGGEIVADDTDVSEYDETQGPVIDLTVTNCEFANLSTKARGGSAMYIMRPGKVVIDSKTRIHDNVNERPSKERWGGGGALWLFDCQEDVADMQIDAIWTNNQGLFQHSLGGAIMVEALAGNLRVGGEFRGNKAADGGAIHVFVLESTGQLDVDAVFDRNEAVEYGWGARGAAVRVEYVHGTAKFDGTYTNNKSGGRGGVFASNRIYRTAKYTIRGTYMNNVAQGTGGVFDQLSSYAFQSGATFTVDGSCVFKGNKSKQRAATNVLNLGPLRKSLSESQWKGKTIVYTN